MTRNVLYIVVSLVLAAVLLFFLSREDQIVVYQSVYSSVKWSDTNEKVLKFKWYEAPPVFFVSDNKLFLKIQTTQTKFFLYVYADILEWNVERIQALMRDRPELKNFFPNAAAQNGGVAWIPEK